MATVLCILRRKWNFVSEGQERVKQLATKQWCGVVGGLCRLLFITDEKGVLREKRGLRCGFGDKRQHGEASAEALWAELML